VTYRFAKSQTIDMSETEKQNVIAKFRRKPFLIISLTLSRSLSHFRTSLVLSLVGYGGYRATRAAGEALEPSPTVVADASAG
jgi:hypothetical protein